MASSASWRGRGRAIRNTVQRIIRALVPYAATLAAFALAAATAAFLPHAPAWVAVYRLAFLSLILASAWWGGYGPGIVATTLSVTVIPLLVVPGYQWRQFSSTQLLLVLTISLLVSRVASGRNEREALLRESNDLLDERVQRRTEELERANNALQEREAMLLRQADELARSNADLQQFAYVASHDLQEPLRLIAIYTELLKRRYGGHMDPEGDRCMDVIVDGVHRLETLIRDLLSYSRAIHAEVPPEKDQVNSSEALQFAAANLELMVKETGATIHCADLPVVACDRVELTQVFQNLLNNALKYRGTDVPRIEIAARTESGEWIFSVRDNGIGIHADHHEAVFTPFKRLHGREYPGTGIGLALCRRIVERQGGRIWVESEPGSGATFFFSIPQPKGRATRAVEVSGYSSGR